MLSGAIESISRKNVVSEITSNHTCIDNRLSLFLEIDEVSRSEVYLIEEEHFCEKHFVKTHTSYTSALRIFYQFKLSFAKNSTHKSSYVEFMSEYVSLGHM